MTPRQALLRLLLACCAFLAPAAPLLAWDAPEARPWERLDGCALKPNNFNDGDSFHVLWQGKEFLFRLYFIDTPEAETSLAERSADQAAYFGVTPERALALGKEAAAFTKAQLGTKPFTVYTRWRDALGRSKLERFYAIVMVEGQDLNERLVGAGLARIYGTRVPLPDGRDSRAYLQKLGALEIAAKGRKTGGWKP